MANASNGVAVEATRRAEVRTLKEEASATAVVSFPREAAFVQVDDVVLSAQQFRRQLYVEKRRTDRTKSPLSLVVVRLESDANGAVPCIDELLELLARSKRETDILGCLGKDRVGLLLPHTDEQGVRAFVGSVSKRTGHLPLSIACATYPDEVFDHLMSDPQHVPDPLAYLFEEQTSRSWVNAWTKRALDIVGALVGIVLASPFMLATAVAVAVTSPGPVIFRQTRLGKGGVPFVLYKFRSMRIDADDRIHREYVANLIQGNLHAINQGDDSRPLYKMSADPRITRVGRFIRATSLDELPQFFNVLKGDMSLVGPRPPLQYEAEKYQSWHLRRVLQARPGITGLWQVEGRSTTSFDDMVRLDLRYIRHCSLLLDLKILLKTIVVVLRRDGAR